MRPHESLDRPQVHANVALAVGRTASQHLPVLDHRYERRRLPQVERVHGLDVVVAVDEDRGRPSRMKPIGVDNGMTAGFGYLDVLHTDAPQVGGHELRGNLSRAESGPALAVASDIAISILGCSVPIVSS